MTRSYPLVWLLALCVAALAAAACNDSPTDAAPTDTEPAVTSVAVEPGTAFLDLSSTLQLTATTTGSGGAAVSDPGLTWRSLSNHVTVETNGLVTGVSAGEARIEAVASNGTTGAAVIRVTPVAGLEPDSGRYGQVVTIQGAELPSNAAVYLRSAANKRVRAYTRAATPEALEIWVPVGAVDGPLELVWPGDSIVTSHVTFDLTAGADIYAGLDDPAPLPFPFSNPSLLATSGTPHAFRFSMPEPSPFSLHISDRGAAYEETAVRAWLFRLDTSPATLVWFGLTRDHGANGAMLDSVTYARAQLPAGEYALTVAALDLAEPEHGGVERAFGIRLSDSADFAVDPDTREPDDDPSHATAVTLPFTSTDARLENAYAMDHYAFELAEPGTVSVRASSELGSLLLVLFPESAPDVVAAWEGDEVLAESEGDGTEQVIQATIPAGRYTALVWDWGGGARPYDLEIALSEASMVVPMEGGAAAARPPARSIAAPAGGGRRVR